MATLTARQEWMQRWPLVLAAIVGFSFHSVVTSFAGLFIGPVGAEFDWSRTQVTAGMTLSSTIGTIISPLFGVMIDRWGTRKLALPGLIMKSIVMAGFGFASGSVAQWLAMWVIYSLVSTMVKSTVWTTAVTGVFTASRGLALGAVMSGTALAQIIVPPLGNWLIDNFGWRQAFAWLGLGWGGVAFVLCLFLLFDAHDDLKKARAAGDAEADRSKLPGLTIPQALRCAALWRVGISTFIMMLFTIALVVHQIPILEEAGVSRTNAAWLASLAGVASIAGKLITGTLMDRFRPNIVGSLTISTAALGFALLLEPMRMPALIVIAMLINGYVSGTKLQICAYLTSRHAGIRNFGTVFSVMASMIALGSGLGPVFGGLVYDAFGSYTVLLIGGICGSLLCAWLIFGVGEYPDWDTKEADTAELEPA
jgi:predicted MFS family arabinose efflux permease